MKTKFTINGERHSGMELLAKVALACVALVAVSFLIAIPLFWLWNWLMPAIFGLSTITWPQAWGLLLMLSMLRGSAGGVSYGK